MIVENPTRLQATFWAERRNGCTHIMVWIPDEGVIDLLSWKTKLQDPEITVTPNTASSLS